MNANNDDLHSRPNQKQHESQAILQNQTQNQKLIIKAEHQTLTKEQAMISKNTQFTLKQNQHKKSKCTAGLQTQKTEQSQKTEIPETN
jgi:hypothetical protein